ncbi:helix-turn-helix domain-containing protein [Brevibacillus ruminantium]|uniref:Helix-turn-helix domain-containing protein n=1 Tax=Brevibacillus ruminantium TaxID=2950604 RepID=A0ABY4WM34_9BACL|nr:helix-turn-helix domain-containing protein [Brevibacillus ruminantium]USG67831.1 helix-turn-helix domain-containing protein [Brevibacillus ruminantium]
MKNALHCIFVSGGSLRVRALAEQEAVSERQLNRKFGQWIGLSPKKFSEVVRFQSVLGQHSKWRNGGFGRACSPAQLIRPGASDLRFSQILRRFSTYSGSRISPEVVRFLQYPYVAIRYTGIIITNGEGEMTR